MTSNMSENLNNIDSSQDVEKNKEQIKADFDTKKWLYAFKSKNPKGEENTFYIAKPSRSLKQTGEIEYAKQLAIFVKSGLLPKAAWNTILENLGGTVSEAEAKDYVESRKRFFELSLELNKLDQLGNLSEEQQSKYLEIRQGIEEAKKNIQAFELEQIYIFENTAEAKARNMTIQWWLTELAYKSENEKFFTGNTFDEKLDWYDDLNPDSEDDIYIIKIGQKFNYLITLWFLNKITSWQDFMVVDSASKKEDS
jgi:hypothetical protein